MDEPRKTSLLHRPDGEPVRVLVVDDEPDVTDVLAGVMAGEGWQVRTAADGVSALATARDFRPDAVVLDWMLPDLDGLHILRALRREAPSVCVLFLTARDAVEDRIRRHHHAAATTTSPSPTAWKKSWPGCAGCSGGPG